MSGNELFNHRNHHVSPATEQLFKSVHPQQIKKWLKQTPLWAFIRRCAVSIVRHSPIPLCRVLARFPWLGLVASAKIMAREPCARWFTGTPGKQVDLIAGLNARKPEALAKAHTLLPYVPQNTCSILDHCHILRGKEADFSGKRVALVAHWDPDNRVDSFVAHYLRALQEAGFATVLASAAPLSTPENDLSHAEVVVYRTCPGYDFTSWKGALELFPSLRRASELLLTNDSVFAPLADIAHVHRVMEDIPCDFWGLMESRDQLPAMPSFYMTFRRNALQHPCFEKFWNSVDTTSNKKLVVQRFEQSQALWFAINGLVPGAYIHWGMLPGIKGGPAYVCWKQLVRLFGVPCIKRAIINGDIWWADNTGWEDLAVEAGYPITLIKDFLSRGHNTSGA